MIGYHPCPNCGHELQKYVEGAATVTRCPECKTVTARKDNDFIFKIVADAGEFDALMAMIEKNLEPPDVPELTRRHYGSLIYEASKLTPAVGEWIDRETARESKRRERDIIDAARNVMLMDDWFERKVMEKDTMNAVKSVFLVDDWPEGTLPTCPKCGGHKLRQKVFRDYAGPYVVGNIVMTYCITCNTKIGQSARPFVRLPNPSDFSHKKRRNRNV